MVSPLPLRSIAFCTLTPTMIDPVVDHSAGGTDRSRSAEVACPDRTRPNADGPTQRQRRRISNRLCLPFAYHFDKPSGGPTLASENRYVYHPVPTTRGEPSTGRPSRSAPASTSSGRAHGGTVPGNLGRPRRSADRQRPAARCLSLIHISEPT